MKVTMELTLDGLLRALKSAAHGLAEDVADGYLAARDENYPNHSAIGRNRERAREVLDELGSR